MYTNVNLAAQMGALALLATALLLLVAAIVIVQSLIARKRGRAKIVLVVMVVIAAIYLASMLIFSFVSREKLLARGEEKHFCELDCHLAYAVTNTRQTKTIGELGNERTAQGQFTIITIRTRFDETSIAPWRGNGPLYPNRRALTLIDERGRRYGPVAQFGTALTSPLRPGESYTTDVAFDMPADVTHATLQINESDWITHLVIGHENSPLHKQTKFLV